MKKKLLFILISFFFLGCFSVVKKISNSEKEYKMLYTEEANNYIWYETYLKKDRIQIDFDEKNPPNKYLFELGGRLLRDPSLSYNNSFSCVDCHKVNLNFADTIQFAQKNFTGKSLAINTTSLTNLSFQKIYGYSGNFSSLENYLGLHITSKNFMNLSEKEIISQFNDNFIYKDLLHKSNTDTILNINTISNALAQYIRSLVAINSDFDIEIRETNLLTKSDSSVFNHFFKAKSKNYINAMMLCKECHTSIAMGGELSKNNGLENFSKKTKVLGLKNISLTAPYMHDGRFKTLKEVVEFYNSGITLNENLSEVLKDENGNAIRLNLTESEISDLVSFLESLTDIKENN